MEHNLEEDVTEWAQRKFGAELLDPNKDREEDGEEQS